QGARDLRDDARRLAEREAAALVEAIEEVLAVEGLPHDERLIAVDAVVEHLHDVGAAELRCGRRLAPEALPRVFALRELWIDELDGHLRRQRQVLRRPDRRL